MVNFVIKQDTKKTFRFAPLQSSAGQQLLIHYALPKKEFDSFVFIENGVPFILSTAALNVMRHLPWYWQWTQVFRILPKSLRDGVYLFVAKHRYRWFGKKEACMVPDADVRSRFL